jgi:hypothetical protein
MLLFMFSQILNIPLRLFIENCLAQRTAGIVNIMLILDFNIRFIRISSSLADRAAVHIASWIVKLFFIFFFQGQSFNLYPWVTLFSKLRRRFGVLT